MTDIASVQLGTLSNYVDGIQAVTQVQDINELISDHVRNLIDRLVSSQDLQFFYTRSHFNALQNSALMFLTNFQFIFTFK